jgi:hypothetical protein
MSKASRATARARHLIVCDAARELEDVRDLVAVRREAVGDERVDVLVGENDHPAAAATTRSARRASMA